MTECFMCGLPVNEADTEKSLKYYKKPCHIGEDTCIELLVAEKKFARKWMGRYKTEVDRLKRALSSIDRDVEVEGDVTIMMPDPATKYPYISLHEYIKRVLGDDDE